MRRSESLEDPVKERRLVRNGGEAVFCTSPKQENDRFSGTQADHGLVTGNVGIEVERIFLVDAD